MKAKYHFEMMELDGDMIAIPVGDRAGEMQGILRLNQTGMDILDCLKEETSEDKILDKLMQKYEGDRNEIAQYVHEFIQKLIDEGIIE